MQGPVELRQVVDVARLAGDMQMRRLVRPADPDPCAGRHRRSLQAVVGRKLFRLQQVVSQLLVDPATSPAGLRCQTLIAWAGRGALTRVSNQNFCSRFCATCIR